MVLPPASRTAAPLADGPPTARGAYHIHSDRSDGSGSVEAIAEAAPRAGLQFIVLTDHGDGTRAPDAPHYRHGVLVIDAVEINTTGGHLVALGLGAAPYPLAGTAADVLDDVRRMGGIGIAAHPDSPRPSLQWTAEAAPLTAWNGSMPTAAGATSRPPVGACRVELCVPGAGLDGRAPRSAR